LWLEYATDEANPTFDTFVERKLTQAFSYDVFVFYGVFTLLMMYVAFDFESKNLIVENKRSYFPHVVDFSKFSQVVVNFTLFSFLS